MQSRYTDISQNEIFGLIIIIKIYVETVYFLPVNIQMENRILIQFDAVKN